MSEDRFDIHEEISGTSEKRLDMSEERLNMS